MTGHRTKFKQYRPAYRPSQCYMLPMYSYAFFTLYRVSVGIFARVGILATTNIVIFKGLVILCMIVFISVDGVDFI